MYLKEKRIKNRLEDVRYIFDVGRSIKYIMKTSVSRRLIRDFRYDMISEEAKVSSLFIFKKGY